MTDEEDTRVNFYMDNSKRFKSQYDNYNSIKIDNSIEFPTAGCNDIMHSIFILFTSVFLNYPYVTEIDMSKNNKRHRKSNKFLNLMYDNSWN